MGRKANKHARVYFKAEYNSTKKRYVFVVATSLDKAKQLWKQRFPGNKLAYTLSKFTTYAPAENEMHDRILGMPIGSFVYTKWMNQLFLDELL